jgi:hypothetical protein
MKECEYTRLGAVDYLSQNLPVKCEEKKRWATEYESSTAKFSDVVTELRKKMRTFAKEEYERLDRAANEARVKFRASASCA